MILIGVCGRSSASQVDYSACDAFASLEMYACAIAKPNSDVRLTSEKTCPGLGVDYVRNKRVVARG